MKFRYILRVDTVADELGHKHIVYGITALNGRGIEVDSFPDIFFDRQKAEDFVELCNSEKLELIHLADAVDDILA